MDDVSLPRLEHFIADYVDWDDDFYSGGPYSPRLTNRRIGIPGGGSPLLSSIRSNGVTLQPLPSCPNLGAVTSLSLSAGREDTYALSKYSEFMRLLNNLPLLAVLSLSGELFFTYDEEDLTQVDMPLLRFLTIDLCYSGPKYVKRLSGSIIANGLQKLSLTLHQKHQGASFHSGLRSHRVSPIYTMLDSLVLCT